MANPFSFITDALGITTPEPAPSWDPQVSYGETAPTMGVPQIPIPLPGMPTGPGPNTTPEPFGLLDVFGIGSQARGQSRAYAQQNAVEQRKTDEGLRQTEAQGQIMRRVGELRNENPDEQPYQTFNRAMQDPVFLKSFHLVPPEQVGALIKSVSEATQAPTKTISQAAGSQATTYNPNTGEQVGSTLKGPPEAHVQLYEWMLSQSDDDLVKLAKARGALGTGKTDSDKEQAWARLRAAGKGTDEYRDKLIAGTVKMTSVPLGNGQTMSMVVDVTDPANTKVLWKGIAEAGQITPVGGPPSMGQPAAPAPTPAAPSLGPPKTDLGPLPPAAPPVPVQAPPAAPPAPAAPAAPQAPAAPPGPAATPPMAPGLIPPAPAFTQPGTSLPPGSSPPPGPTTPQGTPMAPRVPSFMPPQGTPANPLSPPNARDPIEPWDVRKKLLQAPATMFDAAGFAQGGVTAVGRALGQFGHLSRYNNEMSAKQDALAVYDHALTDALKDGRELKEDANLRSKMLASKLRMDDNPASALNRAMGLHDTFMAERNRIIQLLEAKNSDGAPRFGATSARRGKLEAKMDELNGVLATLPTMEQMRGQAKDYFDNGVPDIFKQLPSMGAVKKEGLGQGKALQEKVAPQQAPLPQQPQGRFNLPADEQLQKMHPDKFRDLFTDAVTSGADRAVIDRLRAEALRRKAEELKSIKRPQ